MLHGDQYGSVSIVRKICETCVTYFCWLLTNVSPDDRTECHRARRHDVCYTSVNFSFQGQRSVNI